MCNGEVVFLLPEPYWQGDEPKFENVADTPPGALHLGAVRFDSSSRRFQVTASMPVHEAASGRFIGAVAIGLDIEKALRNPHLNTVSTGLSQEGTSPPKNTNPLPGLSGVFQPVNAPVAKDD